LIARVGKRGKKRHNGVIQRKNFNTPVGWRIGGKWGLALSSAEGLNKREIKEI